MTDDQIALMRIGARSVLEEQAAGRSVDPHRLEWAQQILATHKPLGRPLWTGEPSPSLPHLEAF